MVLNEINHHKTTEVKLNEEMMLAIMHAIGFADDQSIPGSQSHGTNWQARLILKHTYSESMSSIPVASGLINS